MKVNSSNLYIYRQFATAETLTSDFANLWSGYDATLWTLLTELFSTVPTNEIVRESWKGFQEALVTMYI